jgi:hypothetical protein
MEPAAEREGAPPQWLPHSAGQSIDRSYFRAHRTQITAASQRCLQDDKVVVVTQRCLQSMDGGRQ